MSPVPTFTKVLLYTDSDGRSRFRDDAMPMMASGAIGFLSDVFPARGYQLRHSPAGYESPFHCSSVPQWVFVLSGIMEIKLIDGETRQFRAGQSFLSQDLLPDGADFQDGLHGHASRQIGTEPLVTLFVRLS